ncbi:hypothetical protein HY229_02650 [Candidatus Acetothermia bacterium]|nr:hypothetical protein [Candidatus Acetothermia bacterium]MBI3642981.1 hypothetical protein [Candidatus Acetothermia bacterium]
MTRKSRIISSFISVVALLVFLWGAAVQAQTPQEELAKQVISQNTGIDQNQLATLFVTDDADQFILAFVYINDDVMKSHLKPNLKDAVAPYVGKKAMLTLVVPTRDSSFNPLSLTFSQDNATSLLSSDQVHAITDDFLSGHVKTNATSAGIIELPASIDIQKSFSIIYNGKFSAPFSITGVVDASVQQASPNQGAKGFLLFLLQFVLFFLLLPFLI